MHLPAVLDITQVKLRRYTAHPRRDQENLEDVGGLLQSLRDHRRDP